MSTTRKSIHDSARARAKAGAEFLDMKQPGWYEGVSTRALRMEDCTECVIGQLTGSYFSGIQQKFGMDGCSHKAYGLGFMTADADSMMSEDELEPYDFDAADRYERWESDELTTAWRRELLDRKAAA